jgi:hypothetical protein
VLGKTKLRFKGGTLDSGLNVITSNFNASTILAMHVKALKQTGLNWGEIFKYVTLILQIVGVNTLKMMVQIQHQTVLTALPPARPDFKRGAGEGCISVSPTLPTPTT